LIEGKCRNNVSEGRWVQAQHPGAGSNTNRRKMNIFAYLTVNFACNFARSEYAKKSLDLYLLTDVRGTCFHPLHRLESKQHFTVNKNRLTTSNTVIT